MAAFFFFGQDKYSSVHLSPSGFTCLVSWGVEVATFGLKLTSLLTHADVFFQPGKGIWFCGLDDAMSPPSI